MSQNVHGFWAITYALGVEIELRFALRSTVSEIIAIKVSTLAAILDCSKHLKMAKMSIWENAYCPLGRNRAPFCSTIDGFQDNGNRSFGQLATGQNLKIRNFRAKQRYTYHILFPLVLAIHLDHNLRNAGPVLEILC